MTASITDAQETDVLIIGSGPVGLSLANLLGINGVRVTVLEALPSLIDYPRGVGLDDESLRSIQTMGLVEAVLPHTSPQHIMRLVNGRGKVFVEIAPTTDEYGWSRRNGFVQPLVDEELYAGAVARAGVEVRFAHTVESIAESGDHVNVTARNADDELVTFSARYVVGCDGGRSLTRKHIGVSFDGQSPSTRWLVVDVNNDPLGTPNIFLGADPKRPYVSLGLPHAIRRFEFMLFDDEPDSLVDNAVFINKLLSEHVPHADALDIVRQRVYTHHSRIASSFRRGRVFLAGDAAHLMPVWQGQGYNSGVRDATNLAWKLSAVINGISDERLLDTYDVERHDHAKAMIDISTAFGRVIKPTNRIVTAGRDLAAAALNLSPSVKQYFAQMKYKPMPRYRAGAIVDASTLASGVSQGTIVRKIHAISSANTNVSPVGTQFIQPRVDTDTDSGVLLDDVIGTGWGVLLWGSIPEQVFSAEDLAVLDRLGTTFVSIRPVTQTKNTPSAVPNTRVVADVTGRLKKWFDDRPTPVVFLRPDRFVAAACLNQDASATLRSLTRAIHLLPVAAVAPAPAAEPHLAAK
ncbi:bifunctional 3-(3-hydroxy-phenyl)propionate/3-hydroxycinnamic acid hydroxylase [Klugiella xanthotipulae]|uniref:3-(3-hydroxy-phenyl)propionate hydroxylase n=1 Tax=Klugiella xanthotipulae TaxID=244735 RepID=A0A543HXZ4_9MICO|nr:bifunctional 3-(3-hydroxy-phenyl)propionate/3-hydroxycinnamic acid hydroxylase [Klugiella xanthotipulae]TQM63105.1 3-(3-hydroxy-phenyl)propionate hydroxylase [Klugiella xanthotipulae]